MKILIVIENSRVSLELDDGSPVNITSDLPLLNLESKNLQEKTTSSASVNELKPSVVDLPGKVQTKTIRVPFIERNGTPSVKEVPASVNRLPEEKLAVTKSEAGRKCRICGSSLEGAHHLRVICTKPGCQQEYKRQKNFEYFEKKSGKSSGVPAASEKKDSSNWKPTPTFPESIPTGSVGKQMVDPNFEDPYNCSMCRTAHQICSFHLSMQSNTTKRRM